jgi:hypothetical protein
MYDEWTRKLPDGRIVRYTSYAEPGQPARITATIDHRTKTLEVDEADAVPTREEVEEHFEIVGLG